MASGTEPRCLLGLRNFAAEDPGGWDRLIAWVEAADAAGIDGVTLADHVVFGEHLDAYADPRRGGRTGGTQPTGPDGHWLESLALIAFLAARTARLRFQTSILIAALRRPVVLAKQAATIDVLSGGRLDLGVGVGWQREEYEAAGLDFSVRGRLLDETLEICRALWREPVVDLERPPARLERIHMMPKPVQPGGVPIWVSGTVNDRAMARLARFGDGWIPWGPDEADPVAGVARMRRALERLGRDPSGIRVVADVPVVRDGDGRVDLAAGLASVPGMVAAGVTDFRLPIAPTWDPAAAAEVLRGAAAAFRERC